MKPLKERISITIDGDVVVKLREWAEKYDRSVSQVVNIILKDYLFAQELPAEVGHILHGK